MTFLLLKSRLWQSRAERQEVIPKQMEEQWQLKQETHFR
jgi:hypothetical protein